VAGYCFSTRFDGIPAQRHHLALNFLSSDHASN
jgi:hypothetical protein